MATATLPIYMRIGDGEESHIGDVIFNPREETYTARRSAVAAALRTAADHIENAEES